MSQTDVPRGMYIREFLVSLKSYYLYTRSSGDTVARKHSSDTTAKEAEGARFLCRLARVALRGLCWTSAVAPCSGGRRGLAGNAV